MVGISNIVANGKEKTNDIKGSAAAVVAARAVQLGTRPISLACEDEMSTVTGP